jgi:hypothetical protein
MATEGIWTTSAGNVVTYIRTKTGQALHGIWYPSCGKINVDNYFRLVIPAKKCVKLARSIEVDEGCM